MVAQLPSGVAACPGLHTFAGLMVALARAPLTLEAFTDNGEPPPPLVMLALC